MAVILIMVTIALIAYFKPFPIQWLLDRSAEKKAKQAAFQAQIDQMTPLEKEQYAALRAKARLDAGIGLWWLLGPLGLILYGISKRYDLKKERKKLGLKNSWF